MSKPIVYYSKTITPEQVCRMYEVLGHKLTGPVAVRVHSGEQGNQNYLRPAFMKPFVDMIHGTIVECNTAYGGARNETQKHKKLLASHGWSTYFDVDLMDEEGNDLVLPVPNGKVLKENYVGRHIEKYASMVVLSHFKGHPMGGFGGALKQLSIGCASSAGKAWIHSGGRNLDQYTLWDDLPEQDVFLESMADAASSVVSYFKGRMAFINVMCNLSVDCDCCEVAEDPCMKDIGILSSTDPVALDQACLDLIRKSDDPGKAHFLERVDSRHGEHTIESAAALGFGSREYLLEEI